MLVAPEREQLPVAEARRGDARAWEAVLSRYRLPLYAYVVELVHHQQAALDIVQESFINAARHIGTLQDDGKFASWLFNIAQQKVAQHWRKQTWREVALDEDETELPAGLPGPDDFLIRKEQEEAVMKWLGQLAPPHRAVLLLHCIEEFSLAEIAAITETEIGTVKSRLHYARRALRKLVSEDENLA